MKWFKAKEMKERIEIITIFMLTLAVISLAIISLFPSIDEKLALSFILFTLGSISLVNLLERVGVLDRMETSLKTYDAYPSSIQFNTRSFFENKFPLHDRLESAKEVRIISSTNCTLLSSRKDVIMQAVERNVKITFIGVEPGTEAAQYVETYFNSAKLKATPHKRAQGGGMIKEVSP